MALIDDLANYAIDNEIPEAEWSNAIAQLYAVQALIGMEVSESDTYDTEVRLGPDVIITTSARRGIQ